MKKRTHQYRTRCSWTGDTSRGYVHYNRTHRAAATPAEDELSLSADPAFRGDPARLNPEQLLVIAAGSCQLLSFLALAALEKVGIYAYEDNAEAEMNEDDTPVRLNAIRLNPVITVGPDVDEKRIIELVRLAHDQCYIANTLRCSIDVTPRILRSRAEKDG